MFLFEAALLVASKTGIFRDIRNYIGLVEDGLGATRNK